MYQERLAQCSQYTQWHYGQYVTGVGYGAAVYAWRYMTLYWRELCEVKILTKLVE